MAKFNEADPRWVVEERADGSNVRNWHWTEKDCTSWSKSRLQVLFEDVTLMDSSSDLTILLKSVKSVEGEAFVNNRKNKVIAIFDLVLKLSWEGYHKEEACAGRIEVPNLSDEQDEEDWALQVTPSTNSKFSQRCKEAILEKGHLKIRSILKQFVEELKSAQSLEQESTRKAEPEKLVEKPLHDNETHKLDLTERFVANPQDIYECFVNEGKLKAYTQSPAKVEGYVNGSFAWFDGSISGKFIEMEAPKLLVLDWRFNNWSEGHYSQVQLTFDNPEPGLTIVNLHQTGIPGSDKFGNGNVAEVTEAGWRDRIMQKIRLVFGYGI